MPRFSWRNIDKHTLRIFNHTGKVVQLIMRKGVITPGTYVPGVLFTAHEDVTENPTNISTMYIKGKFEETDVQTPTELGRMKTVKGILTFPLLYVKYLQLAEYVDPYLDGSRFSKTGSIVDEGRLFATVELQSMTLTNTAEVVQ